MNYQIINKKLEHWEIIKTEEPINKDLLIFKSFTEAKNYLITQAIVLIKLNKKIISDLKKYKLKNL